MSVSTPGGCVDVDVNATSLPSALIDGLRESPLPGALTIRVSVTERVRVNTSSRELPSAATRFVAPDWNATTAPSVEIDGLHELPLPAALGFGISRPSRRLTIVVSSSDSWRT